MKIIHIRNLANTGLQVSMLGLFFFMMSVLSSCAPQNVRAAATNSQQAEQEIKDLSKAKWQWMADKDVDKLAPFFHNRSKFVHMSGTWNKDEELDIIKTGRIWYKNAEVHDVVVEMVDDTAILWNRITLQAVVRGEEVSTEFTVTEVYEKQENTWKLLALTFSSVRDTHRIEH